MEMSGICTKFRFDHFTQLFSWKFNLVPIPCCCWFCGKALKGRNHGIPQFHTSVTKSFGGFLACLVFVNLHIYIIYIYVALLK